MKKYTVLLTLCLALVACGGTGSTKAATQQTDNTDLLGVVTNPNGIRDDINLYIEKNFGGNLAKKRAAIIVARSNQKILEFIGSGGVLTQERFTQDGFASVCLILNSDADNYFAEVKEFEARTFNTEARLRAYRLYSKQADGMLMGTPDVADPCAAAQG